LLNLYFFPAFQMETQRLDVEGSHNLGSAYRNIWHWLTFNKICQVFLTLLKTATDFLFVSTLLSPWKTPKIYDTDISLS
jgi:hypothetical protein